MAAEAFVGVGGVPRNMTECYVGAGGVRAVQEIYVGVGGVPRLCWCGDKWASKIYLHKGEQLTEIDYQTLSKLASRNKGALTACSDGGSGKKSLYQPYQNGSEQGTRKFDIATLAVIGTSPNFWRLGQADEFQNYLYWQFGTTFRRLDRNSLTEIDQGQMRGYNYVTLSSTTDYQYMMYPENESGSRRGIRKITYAANVQFILGNIMITNIVANVSNFVASKNGFYVLQKDSVMAATGTMVRYDLNTGAQITSSENGAGYDIYSPKK